MQEERPDWTFEAFIPASPLSIGSSFRSALARNLVHSATASERPSPRPVPPRQGLERGPSRLFRILRHGFPLWQLARLESDPFESGPVRCSPVLPAPEALRADPFPLRAAGSDWLLFEEQARGGIGRLRASFLEDGIWQTREGEILPRDFHLSWPNVFQLGDRILMLPETGAARELSLLEAEDFPVRWKTVRTLLKDAPWHDPCVFQHEGLWWLFTSRGGDSPNDHSAELQAFWTDDLEGGELHPHALNPLSVSVAGSRPAGRVFQHEGRLHRPAQDSRGGYGTGILLQRIDRLTPTEWSETTVSLLEPPAGSVGIHTLNRLPDGGWIVDVCG